jgi:precorrin-8X/cobalt-precorrin-8 methylmutase
VLEQFERRLAAERTIYTDTTMALSGINKTLLANSAANAAATSATRGWCVGKRAGDYPLDGGGRYCGEGRGRKVFVFGNAPTALFRLLEHDVLSAVWLAYRSGSSARRSRKRR